MPRPRSIRAPCELVFVRAIRPRSEYDHARQLLASGMTIDAVARATGIPRSTIGYWRRTPTRRGSHSTRVPPSWRPPDPAAYGYLLGLYLGDGCIFRASRAIILRLYLDERYGEVVEAAASAIPRVFPEAVVRRYRRSGMVILHAAHQSWATAFPQHGPGKKHLRPIRLEPWAAGDHARPSSGADPRPDPLGRVPLGQPFQDYAPERPGRRVRVHAVLLLEPVRGHQGPVLRALRPARHPALARAPALRVGPRSRKRRAAGLVRRAEAVTCGWRDSNPQGTKPTAS